jgi:hypothetical protein
MNVRLLYFKESLTLLVGSAFAVHDTLPDRINPFILSANPNRLVHLDCSLLFLRLLGLGQADL